jgi:metal-sulfur cluster biosynthetic enzyme
MSDRLDNENPQVFQVTELHRDLTPEEQDDPIDALEVFGTRLTRACSFSSQRQEHVRHIVDPEHPMTLEQLAVVNPSLIEVDDAHNHVLVKFTPTVNHCSMATLIGLCIRVKLNRVLPPRFKVDVEVAEGSHDQEPGVNKQLNDKERVAAALDNPNLLAMVNRGLVRC